MPEEEDAPWISDQLLDALDATKVSRSELARRLAASDDTKPSSKRRWIQKLLKDEVDVPDMTAVAAALGLPANHFIVPSPDQVQRRRARLEQLEEEIGVLGDSILILLETSTLLAQQVVALGGEVPSEMLDALRQATVGRRS